MTDPGYMDFHENKIKHLEMVQAVIARLGNDSFLVKGWALTVAGAFFGFAINATKPGLAWASLVPSALFWGLDVHFLRAERLFRVLFEYVRTDDSIEPFFMNAPAKSFVERVKKDERHKNSASWFKNFKRPTLAIFYGTLIVVAFVLILLIETHATVLQPHPAVTPSP